MARPSLLFAIAIAYSSFCHAGDSPSEVSILRVYPVGDLVCADALHRSSGGKTSSHAWASEYPETLKALEELRSIVDAMYPQDSVTVTSYAPSLCLIVRHSQSGHDEIDQLLRDLNKGSDSSILIECRALFTGSRAEPDHQHASETEQNRMHALLSKRTLTKSETTELMTLLPPISPQKEAVTLKPGRRTPWGHAGRPCTATGRINHSKNTIELRIDYISDDFAQATPFGSETFSLAKGENALFHHYCDGGTVVWLISARGDSDGTPATLTLESDRSSSVEP